MADVVPPLITNLDQLTILDVLVDQRFMVCTFKKGERKWLWVSEGQARDSGLAKEFFLKMEMNSGQSQAMEEFQEEVYTKVQCLGETFAKTKTVHPGGKPRNLLQTFRPIRMKLPDWHEEKTVALLEIQDADVKGHEMSNEYGKMAMAAELLQHSETITMMFDAATGTLEYGNQKMAKLYERAVDESQAVRNSMGSLNELFEYIMWEDEEQREVVSSSVRSLELGGKAVEFDCRLVFPNIPIHEQPEIWHQFHFIPALSPVTSNPVVIVTQSDITKLQQQSTQLLEASRQQEAFTSAVSHELRTPLNGIIGLSESLIQNPDCTEKMLKTLKLVKSSGMRLAALVNDILDAASARRGRFVIKRELVLLKEVADNCCEMLQSICPRNVKLVNRVDEDKSLSHIEGDSSRINQILTNLLSNAIKFTEKGTVSLSSRLVSPDEVLVEVTDTGCGIPEDKWEQVWCPFKQVDMSTTRKYGGTGLGLSLVKELVEAHNGRVGLSSRLDGTDRGSTFFFVLPMRQPRSEEGSSDTANLPPLHEHEVSAGVLTRAASTASELLERATSRASQRSGTERGGITPSSTVAEPRTPAEAPRAGRALTKQVQKGEENGVSKEEEARRQVEAVKQTAVALSAEERARRAEGDRRLPPALMVERPGRRSSVEIERMKDDARSLMRLASLDRDAQQPEEINVVGAHSNAPGVDSSRLKHHSEINGTFEILSVDDHVVNHIVVENSLNPKGYMVTTCMSGTEALNLLETRGYLPDLILLDCMMPKMSGYEMCEKLREQYPCNTLPVIMVSAKNQEDDIVKGLQAGCNDYISKELNARIDVQFRLRYLWHMEVSKALSRRDSVLHPPNTPERAARRSSLVTGELGKHKDCTVLLCDICDMLYYVRATSAQDLAVLVNQLYDRFDSVARKHGLTRIIDDSYMLVLENPSMAASEQAAEMLQVAQELLAEVPEVRIRVKGVEESPKVRVGMARGTTYSAITGMKMTTYTYFGQAVRDAVKVTVKSPAGCVVMTEALMMELADPSAVTKYARQSAGGEMMYIARVGPYEQAVQAVAGSDGEPLDVQSDLGSDAMNPLTHLRAFMRLSTQVDDVDRIASGASLLESAQGAEGCRRCQELQAKLEAAELELEREGESGNASQGSSFDRRPSSGFGEAPTPKNKGHRGSVESGASMSVSVGGNSQEVPFGRSPSVASNLRLAVTQPICEECQDLRSRLDEATFELKKCKDELRKRTEESYKNEMSTPHHGAQIRPSTNLAPETQEVEILSVDDDPVNQMVVENLLEPLGYKVHACMNGIEALEYLRTCSRLPNLVLLDVMMPQMNGYECCQQIRETYNRMALPVIMVSAKSQVESVVEGLEAGCNDYVSKPFNRVELLARISTQLRVRDASRAEVEVAKANKLLTRLLPEHIIIQLRQNQTMIFEEHRNTTVLCCCIIGFGELVASLPSMELFSIFSRMVDNFVELGERHGCSLASIAGDAVVMVVGHDGRVADEHAGCAVRMGLDMLRAVKEMTFPRNPEKHLQIRVGLHSGISYAGVLGTRMPRYEFLGDSVMIARAMEQDAFAMNIRLTSHTAALLGEGWELEPAGKCRVPGQGMVESFLVKDAACEWQAALDLMALSNDERRLSGGDVHDATASFTRRMALLGGNIGSRLDSVDESDHEQLSDPSPKSSARGAGDGGAPSVAAGGRAAGLTKEDVAEVVKSVLQAMPPQVPLSESHADSSRLSALAAAVLETAQVRTPAGASPLRVPGVGSAGACEACAEKEALLRDREGRLAAAELTVDSLKADNIKLISACSGLADQARLTAASAPAHAAPPQPPPQTPPRDLPPPASDPPRHPIEPQPYANAPHPPPHNYGPPQHPPDFGYPDERTPYRFSEAPMQRGAMGYLGGPAPAPGRQPRPPLPGMANSNRAESMLAGLYMSAQEQVLGTLLRSCMDSDARPPAPYMQQPPYDPAATPAHSWGPTPGPRDPGAHPDYARSQGWAAPAPAPYAQQTPHAAPYAQQTPHAAPYAQPTPHAWPRQDPPDAMGAAGPAGWQRPPVPDYARGGGPAPGGFPAGYSPEGARGRPDPRGYYGSPAAGYSLEAAADRPDPRGYGAGVQGMPARPAGAEGPGAGPNTRPSQEMLQD